LIDYFLISTLHSLHVLTRPLADVSAPKRTAVGPPSSHDWRAFFFLKQQIKKANSGQF
jgi:hypothetical protein